MLPKDIPMEVSHFQLKQVFLIATLGLVGVFIPTETEKHLWAASYSKAVSFSSLPPKEKTGGFSRERLQYGLKNREVFVSLPATFGFRGNNLSYSQEIRQIRLARTQSVQRPLAIAPVKVTKDLKHPNSVLIPLSQAPTISQKTRKLNGRIVCAKKNDEGNKSKQKGKKVHIDKECCLDPDEVPNPRCYYPELGAQNSPDRNGR